MKTRFTSIAVLMIVLLAGTGLSMSQKNKPSKNISLTIQFANRAGDRIIGAGAYSDGVDRVTALFNNDYTGDLIFRVGRAEPISQYFAGAAFCGSPEGSGGTQATGITVFKAGLLPTGSTGTFAAKSTSTDGVYTLCFGRMDQETSDFLAQSTRVTVYHQDEDTWIVTTTTGVEDQNPAAGCAAEEAGDKAALLQTAGKPARTSGVGYYHMPFQFIATRKSN